MNRSALAPLSDGGLWGLESTQLEPGCLSADNGEVLMGRGKAIGRQVDQDGNFKSVTENNLTILIKQSVYVGVGQKLLIFILPRVVGGCLLLSGQFACWLKFF